MAGSRFIPIDLKDRIRQDATTLCVLIRIDPVQTGVSSYGITTLDRDFVYDDSISELRYSAAIGAQPTTLQGSSDLSVDNAESTSLMPVFDVPVREEDIRAGLYDFAEFVAYLVDYTVPEAGHITLRRGTLGRVTIDNDGLSQVNELRGLAAQLKQSLCEKDSLPCRATYGSQPAGSVIPGPIERFPCGKDATAELVAFTVSTVGIENTLSFTVGSFSLPADALNPGMVFWTTGANAGKSYEVDTNTADGDITLAHEAAFAIQNGDQGFYRPDCNKLARDEEKGCAAPHHWGPEWPLHHRGEPDIPIGDAGQLETPGASSPPGAGGYIRFPIETVAE